MSKESRRRQRAASQSSGGSTANKPATGGSSGPAASGAGASGSGSRTSSSGARPGDRAGRRVRARPATQKSFAERYRSIIIAVAVLGGVAVIGAFVATSASAKVYACTEIWEPAPTASPAAGVSPQPGYVQPDMGQGHVPVGTQITYTTCPPASGRHYAQPAAPIPARPYGPGDAVIPQGWIHNLEHGGLVLLYRGDSESATEAGQAALRAFFDEFPESPVCAFPPGGQSPGPVFAPFDDMAWPLAAMVWDRVLPLQSLDTAAILDFYATYGEKTNPERLCAAPSASPSASAAPSGSAAPSATPAAPSGTAAPSGSVAPSGSAAPSPSAS